jgi:hypothetical protein
MILRHLTLGLVILLSGAMVGQVAFSSTLPIIAIHTDGADIPDEPKTTVRMGVIDNGPGQLNRPTDPFNEYDGYVGIEFRGSSTQSFEKKGYGLETRFEDGSDRQTTLLGFPREEDWVLRGPFSDKSLIRDALAYTLAGNIMTYAPRVRLVELLINNDYRGVYLFAESIKRDRRRVDIKRMEPEDNSGDELTGGYILKVDKFTAEAEGVPSFFPSRYAADNNPDVTPNYLYHYPKPEDITAPQRTYISDWMGDFEEALASDDFRHPNRGYAPFIDVASFVDFLLINELTRNVDGYRLSTYMYKKRDSEGGRLHMGPIWDYNLAFGNADYCNGALATGWAFNFNNICPDDGFQVPFTWKRLMQDENFSSLVRERWSELRNGSFSDERINATIDSLVAVMDNAPARNFQRWPILEQYIWPNAFIGGSYAAETDYLRRWIGERTRWLDGAILTLSDVTSSANAVTPPLPIYPNPTNGFFAVINDDTGDLADLTVRNQIGQSVFFTARLGRGDRVDLSAQPAGVYFVQGRRGDGKFVSGKVVLRGR